MAPLLCLCTILAFELPLVQAVLGITATFSTNATMNKLTVDTASGLVYVGATNKLYQLDAGLKLSKTVTTGPEMDNPLCTKHEDSDTCDYGTTTIQKDWTDNVNKILAIDKRNSHLITCGSVYQGFCQVRDLGDITTSQAYENREEYRIAANDATMSTVAFVAPGPPDPNQTDVLYVGTTFTGIALRHDTPAVSSRALVGAKVLNYAVRVEDIQDTKNTWIKLSKHLRKDYIVNYVTGFSTNGFSYFMTVQRSSTTTKDYVSKIIQICQSDDSYSSYVEMPITCGAYNIIQSAAVVQPGSDLQEMGPLVIATFSKSAAPDSDVTTATSESAVCVYRLSAIREKFTENIKHCFEGNGNLGAQFTTAVCIKPEEDITIQNDYCGTPGKNTPLAGMLPLYADPVFVSPTSRLSAVVATTTLGKYTVAFAATSQGHVKKILITASSGSIIGKEFEDIVIEEGEAISSDLVFSQSHTDLYVMTTHKIFKIPVQQCHQFDCSECRKDPFCGWCLLDKKCSTKPDCSNSDVTKRWLPFASSSCRGITTVEPSKASINNLVQVKLTVPNLPPLSDSHIYTCLFGDVETSASVNHDGLVCDKPEVSSLPTIQQPRDYISVNLTIRSSETMVSFLQTNIDFYDCSMHESCSACTSASWGCHWCTHENKCTWGNTCTLESGLQSGSACPRLEKNGEILLPAEFQKEILLRGSNFPEPQDVEEDGYECVVHLNPLLRVPATRINGTAVKCQETQYTYASSDDRRTVRLEVIWGHDYLIDDIYETEVTIYKCSELGRDCSRCVSLLGNVTTVKFDCEWCSTNICSYSPTCRQAADKCDPPSIIKVSPLTGPLEGGTMVTITGANLGRSFNQIQNAVKVAGKPCVVISDQYKISIQIVCRTSSVAGPKEGKVEVTVDQLSVSSDTQFRYQDPQVTSVFPTIGPKSGGTTLTISGEMLNTGSKIDVLIGDSVSCKVIDPVSSEELRCLTAGVSVPDNFTSVSVQFDHATRNLETGFEFTEDPNITDIHPLRSFEAGGRTITIEGSYFTSIHQPRMFIIHDEAKSNLTNCSVINTSVIECPAPVLPSGDLRAKRSVSGALTTVGFEMDGVNSVKNLSMYFPDVPSAIQVFPNPLYHKFENGRKVFQGEPLVLLGQDLDLACGPSEVTVLIGTVQCRVKSLSTDNLLCIPPVDQPPGVTAGREDVNKLPVVEVRVSSLVYTLGELEYQRPEDKKGNELWIIGVALGGGFLITVIIIMIIIYKRKSTYAERQYKKMQIQLDTLESNVRNECKQAFAELQTEVSDFTSDLNAKGVPFWDYKTYTFKVLFPSFNDHAILHSTPPSVTTTFGGTDQALSQFNQLLNSKQFLLIFIRTLEEQKSFMIRDKALVASLLMVVLQDKMEYATDILKALLNELIDRSVEKKNPKLMFRRTESVVEKLLTNWMSLCMYDYLKKHAGKMLFVLYKSIKHQTEKGPVDAITSEAKYSLSEDRLLREKIDFHTLNIELTTESSKEPVTCKVLDCDTVTQAKEKALDAIYRNTSFSVRPSIYNVDLEWRSGRSGHLPLQDEDVTTEIKHKMKHVNTLAHYHIPDHSQMTLVPKHDSNEGVRKVHGRLEITSGSTLNAIVEVEDGVKVWHLMKHDDNSNSSRAPKVISEIFLTRLLATKGTLQQFIDDLFMTILRADYTLPPAVKHLFDFLDNAIKRHNILDPEVIHTWKSNSLPLRFWVNIIKNPEFVFDIHKSNIVDSCLSVIAQTFMDSCSTVEHRLGKDSPSNKLLFAKDIPRYRKWVSQFYRNIQEMPAVTDQEMSTAMMELSMNNRLDFNVSVALRELFQYAKQYSFELLEALDDDSSGKKLRLAARFEEVLITSGEPPDY